MDEGFIHEPEHLLIFVRKLKEVFDLCDEDSDGFIRPEHLVQLGSRFGQGEQVRTPENVVSNKVYVFAVLARLTFSGSVPSQFL